MARPLVLLHGFTGSPRSFVPVIEELPPGVRSRIQTPLLLGHGTPPAPAGCTRIQRFEQELDRLASDIKSRGFAGAHLCGYSLGARVALGLLTRHVQLFAGATLISVHPGLSDPAQRAARVGSDENWCTLLGRGTRQFFELWQAQALFRSQQGLAPRLLELQRVARESHTAAGLAHALRVLGLGRMPNYSAALRAGARPRVTLMAGSLDAKFLAIARAFEGAPALRVEVVDGAGHNLLLEAPRQVARVLTTELHA